jgi:excisionase family DNA binding protein
MPKNKSGPPTERAEHRFARINAAAGYLDVHPVTVRKLIEDGKIHGYRSGQRLLRVDLNEIDAYLAGEGQ